MLSSPQIACPELPAIETTADLIAVIHAFRAAPVCKLQQAWRTEPEPGFAPATVRVGWRDNTLLLLAELEDADVFTFARHNNERLWELGDTLEIFLRAADQPAYSEFHVAPNNLRLQLGFTSADHSEQARRNGSFASLIVHDITFNSRTWVLPKINCWYAFVEIPVASVSHAPDCLTGLKCQFSFCRYDYTRGCPVPVISSTSAHSRPDFHCREEWGTLRFQPRKTNYETANLVNVASQPG